MSVIEHNHQSETAALPTMVLPYPAGVLRWLARMPLYLYQLGLGWTILWIPVLVLTTRGRSSGQPRHVVLEWRRHGSKYYVVSAWGKRPHWYRNLLAAPMVTVQYGNRVFRARATPVQDPNEAARAVYMFRKNSPLYEVLFSRMVSVPTINFRTLSEVAGEFTVIRLDPEAGALDLPGVPQLPAWLLPGVLVLGLVLLMFRNIGNRRSASENA
jgi:deazaflavin-dependent oxidoreductase (nitroreductase family)